MLMGNENSSFYLDKTSGDLYTNKSLDREVLDAYNLYILCSIKSELHVTDAERAAFSIKSLDSDNAVAKVQVVVLDENDNPPVFEKTVRYLLQACRHHILTHSTYFSDILRWRECQIFFESVSSCSKCYRQGFRSKFNVRNAHCCV